MRKNPGPLVRSVDRGAPTVIEGVAHAVDAVFAGQEGDGPVAPGRVEVAPLGDRQLAKAFAGDDADYPLEVRS